MTTAVLLSGGVDSSVALWRRAEEAARDLRAYYLKVWLEDQLPFAGECPGEVPLRRARAGGAVPGVHPSLLPGLRE